MNQNKWEKPVVAVLGEAASFHDIASRKFFGNNFESLHSKGFAAMFRALEEGLATHAVLAIENSIAGTILPNYARLRDSGLKICGEVILRIHLHLLALPGSRAEELSEVYSHPMAILESEDYFKDFPGIRLIETGDTAAAAARIAKLGEKSRGAIASKAAASLYGLNILAEKIESNPRNFTRFLVLSSLEEDPSTKKSIDKASICFVLSHKSGSLASILNCLSEYGLNLTKIQSLPLIEREWQYFFHVDLEFEDISEFKDALMKLSVMTSSLRVLGIYSKGRTFEED